MTSMRIALISTSALPVPPRAYGGTELFVFELSKMLTKRGHDVTVYATGDSRPRARLWHHFEHAKWPPDEHVELRHVAHAWKDILAQSPAFDVVHANQLQALPFAVSHHTPTVLTLHHERNEAFVEFYADFPGIAYVGISRRQVELMPELDTPYFVHHGLDPALYPFGPGDGGYCAFLGRLAPEKGPHLAIDAARLAQVPLRIGGVPHWVNMQFFDDQMEPRVDAAGPFVDYLGEVSHEPKVELLRHAKALLFPIQWDEPFGLVMIEAMLVGTPVLAFARGSVPEVVEDGVTGYIVRDVNEMATRLRHIGSFDREACRRRAEQRWSSMRMAREYERVYAEVVSGRAAEVRSGSGKVRRARPFVFEEVSQDAELFSPFFRSA